MRTKSADPIGNVASGYSDGQQPLGSYALLTGIFATTFAGGLALARKHRGGFPEHVPAADVAMLGIATHKLARLIGKERVTSFVRAPFVRYQDSAGRGELDEKPRGTGLQLAAGQLLGCPYCLGQWVIAGLTVSYVAAPNFTRLIAAAYTAETAADFLQLAYRAAERRAG